jgi:hypothetical protein
MKSTSARRNYGRLLRYVDQPDGTDAGLAQIAGGFAIARYDGRDGYGHHPRQELYVATTPAVCSGGGIAPRPRSRTTRTAPPPEPPGLRRCTEASPGCRPASTATGSPANSPRRGLRSMFGASGVDPCFGAENVDTDASRTEGAIGAHRTAELRNGAAE